MTIASEITRLQGAKADIKTAIENKGVTVPNADTIDQYAGYIDQIETGTTIVNGVIKNYLASTSTVDAGTFVEFVNTVGAGTEVLSAANSGYDICAVALDSTRIFVSYHDASDPLYGAVVTVSGDTMTAGSLATLATGQVWGSHATAAMPNGKVFVAYQYGVQFQCATFTISGDTITRDATSSVLSSSANQYGNTLSAVVLDDERVFAIYNAGSYPGFVVATIGDGSISLGTAVWPSSLFKPHNTATLISSNKVFVATSQHSSSSSGSIYGAVCTISGTTITVGSTTALTNSAAYTTSVLSSAMLDSSRVLLCYSRNNCLCVKLVTINGTSLSTGTETVLYTSSYNSLQANFLASVTTIFRNGNVYITAYTPAEASTKSIMLMSVKAVGDSMVLLKTDLITAGGNSYYHGNGVVQLTNGLAIFYSNSSSHCGGAFSTIGVQASTSYIDGFTKTEATTSTPGEVWVLSS